MEEARQLIEQNDEDLSKRETELIRNVNKAYKEAIMQAVKEFQYLAKINPLIKPSSEQVKKIVARVIESFSSEFNKLSEPFRKELLRQYEKGLVEAAQLLALRDQTIKKTTPET